MFNSPILEVAIGLFFIFLLYSLLATALREMVAGLLDQRAVTLYNGIRSMLTDTDEEKGKLMLLFNWASKRIKSLSHWFVHLLNNKPKDTLYDKFYSHPIIKNYGQNYLYRKPSYISPQNFSSILLEVIKDIDKANKDVPVTMEMIKEVLESDKIKKYIEKDLREILYFHINASGGDIDVFKSRLEQWFNDSMDRVSGWYKRNNQYWLFAIGFVLAMIFNLDTIETAERLSVNHKAREQLVSMAQTYIESDGPSNVDSTFTQEVITTIRKDLDNVNMVVGLGWAEFGKGDSIYIKDSAKMKKPGGFHRFMSRIPVVGIYSQMKMNVYQSIDSTYLSSLRQMNVLSGDSLEYKKNGFRIERLVKRTQTDSMYVKQRILLENFDKNTFVMASNDFRLWYVKYQMGWRKVFSFFITAVAIGLGAPFWFDTLSKLTKLRSTGKVIDTVGNVKNKTSQNNDAEG
jgi:hypothetical protein